jgi:hypothetical protein
MRETADDLRHHEAQRLDRLLESVWATATTSGVPRQLWAIDRVLAIMGRRAQLLGLDAGSGNATTAQAVQDFLAGAEAMRAWWHERPGTGTSRRERAWRSRRPSARGVTAPWPESREYAKFETPGSRRPTRPEPPWISCNISHRKVPPKFRGVGPTLCRKTRAYFKKGLRARPRHHPLQITFGQR